jgi:glucosamine--fructose-6-phosphate aminotransferase (isomerizing)
VHALRAAGWRAFAVSSAELGRSGSARLGDAFVLVSQSGASAETVAALERLDGAPVIAVSSRGDSPLAGAARVSLPLGPFPDTPVATLSYTATLQSLGMLCEALIGGSDDVSTWERLPSLASSLLDRAGGWASRAAGMFAAVSALDAVGGGPARASAGETALLGREALRLAATGMETRTYLHGPLEAVDARFGAIVFGGQREAELAAEIASYGAAVALLSDSDGIGELPGVSALELPRVDPLAAPILQILPVQLLVDEVAALRGLTIGELRRSQRDTKVG